MEKTKILRYDGSFNGFLTAIYTAFDQKIRVADIQPTAQAQNGLFTDTAIIFTQIDKAKRVWQGIENQNFNAIKNIYFAYLSEGRGIEMILYRYIIALFTDSNSRDKEEFENLGMQLIALADSVKREKQRMEATIKFHKTGDDVYMASVEPKYNILPLISKYFRLRYPEHSWIIYDLKRQYGLYYHEKAMELISIDQAAINQLRGIQSSGSKPAKELQDQLLSNVTVKNKIRGKVYQAVRSTKIRERKQEKKAV